MDPQQEMYIATRRVLLLLLLGAVLDGKLRLLLLRWAREPLSLCKRRDQLTWYFAPSSAADQLRRPKLGLGIHVADFHLWQFLTAEVLTFVLTMRRVD